MTHSTAVGGIMLDKYKSDIQMVAFGFAFVGMMFVEQYGIKVFCMGWSANYLMQLFLFQD